MRSSAPNASAMQVDIARVFALARRGLTPQRPVDAEAIAAKVVERVLGLLGGRLAAIEAKS